VKIISGQRLGEFLKENVFDPLGIGDTGFFMPKEKMHRVAQGYDYFTKKHPVYLLDAGKEPSIDSGAGGSLSTLKDYGKFSQMILNKGQLNGTRVLGCKTVAYMTANHISDQVDKGDLYLPGDGYGFGLGFAVKTHSGLSPEVGSKGERAWSGWAGTGFWIDPEENMISLFMIQDVINAGSPLRSRFKSMVYQAIID